MTVEENGYFGEFGGAYVPEMLWPNVTELQQEYLTILSSDEFQRQFQHLLKEYAGRPTPLSLAERLSRKVGFDVYLKREDLLHTGSHKINNTIGQILVAKRLGKSRIIAETGAGQHGVATATVCALMGMPCVVFMGAVDVERQALNVARMKMLGAEVRPVYSGSKTLKDATNEALREWISRPRDTHYILGSVVGPHPFPDMVARLQSVISKEIKEQACEKGINPTHIVACVGGGSNAMGAFYHYLDDSNVTLIGVEAAGEGTQSGRSAATTALGRKGVLHGSCTLFMQTDDGQVEEAHSISAGLDYPGIGPQHAFLFTSGRAQYVNVTDTEAVKGAELLAREEGIIPALESAHAVSFLSQGDIPGGSCAVLIVSGRGDKDMTTYLHHLSKESCG
jgi:tryptophan synthase beta chain